MISSKKQKCIIHKIMKIMSKKEDKVIDKLSTGNTISYSVDILLIFARLQARG